MVERAPAAKLFGLAAAFDCEEAIVEAVREVHAKGYRRAEAYTPYAVEALPDVFDRSPSRVPLIALCGALTGGITAFAMMWYASVVSYPLNIGGKPLDSWPAFIPITFELTVLFAGLSAVFGMFALCGLPQPYHPMFNLPAFRRASRDRFFLCIETKDPLFDQEQTRALLEGLNPIAIMEVPNR